MEIIYTKERFPSFSQIPAHYRGSDKTLEVGDRVVMLHVSNEESKEYLGKVLTVERKHETTDTGLCDEYISFSKSVDNWYDPVRCMKIPNGVTPSIYCIDDLDCYPRFNIGDQVRIKTGTLEHKHVSFQHEMREFQGNVYKVKSRILNKSGIRYKLKGTTWTWVDQWLDPVSESVTSSEPVNEPKMADYPTHNLQKGWHFRIKDDKIIGAFYLSEPVGVHNSELNLPGFWKNLRFGKYLYRADGLQSQNGQSLTDKQMQFLKSCFYNESVARFGSSVNRVTFDKSFTFTVIERPNGPQNISMSIDGNTVRWPGGCRIWDAGEWAKPKEETKSISKTSQNPECQFMKGWYFEIHHDEIMGAFYVDDPFTTDASSIQRDGFWSDKYSEGLIYSVSYVQAQSTQLTQDQIDYLQKGFYNESMKRFISTKRISVRTGKAESTGKPYIVINKPGSPADIKIDPSGEIVYWPDLCRIWNYGWWGERLDDQKKTTIYCYKEKSLDIDKYADGMTRSNSYDFSERKNRRAVVLKDDRIHTSSERKERIGQIGIILDNSTCPNMKFSNGEKFCYSSDEIYILEDNETPEIHFVKDFEPHESEIKKNAEPDSPDRSDLPHRPRVYAWKKEHGIITSTTVDFTTDLSKLVNKPSEHPYSKGVDQKDPVAKNTVVALTYLIKRDLKQGLGLSSLATAFMVIDWSMGYLAYIKSSTGVTYKVGKNQLQILDRKPVKDHSELNKYKVVNSESTIQQDNDPTEYPKYPLTVKEAFPLSAIANPDDDLPSLSLRSSKTKKKSKSSKPLIRTDDDEDLLLL